MRTPWPIHLPAVAQASRARAAASSAVGRSQSGSKRKTRRVGGGGGAGSTRPSGPMRSASPGMLAAEALRDMLRHGEDEARAFAAYEKRVKEAFQLSFLGGGVFRALVKTPVLDWLVKAGEQPVVQSAAAKVMAAM